MRKFGSYLYTAGAIIVFTGAIVLTTSRPASSTVGYSLVQVTNGSASAIPVRDLNTGAQQPIQFALLPHSSTSKTATFTYTVPNNKRLVIEYYSAALNQYPVGGYAYVTLETSIGISTNYWTVVPNSATVVSFNQMTRMYADPGTDVIAQVSANTGTSCSATVNIAGYLIDYP